MKISLPTSEEKGWSPSKKGLIAEPAAGWKVSARLARTAYRWGAHSDETRWTLAQHYTLNRDLAVRAAWTQFGEIREFSVGVLVYF